MAGRARLEHAGRPVGYGELWLDECETELARLIVAPSVRGRGVGRDLVRHLTALALVRGPNVFMRVHPANAAALRCYRGAGFVDVDPALAEEWNVAQPVSYVWLAHQSSADSAPPRQS
ncbi:GNAT family N-acetyltransferase [Saccharothrix sp.]|uniref:GNAT family N-acetyltransferase n=1 Tax=Saccharothrix sp. TaxID=1873460 RepID=UPI0035C7928F